MKTLIILPTYNEKENIREITKAILSSIETDILIVDDNSPDGTGSIVDELSQNDPRIKVIHREKKMGLGQAYLAGFGYALKNNYDYIFEMDADFSHQPQELPNFLEAIKNYDLVLGSRYLRGGGIKNWGIRRRALSRFGSLYAKIILSLPISDVTGGFKCYRRGVLEKIGLNQITSFGYVFQIETTYRAFKKGFRIKEIPIIFEDRKIGASKMGWKIVWEAIWRVWKLKFSKIP